MLFTKGINWNNFPTYQKKGVPVVNIKMGCGL